MNISRCTSLQIAIIQTYWARTTCIYQSLVQIKISSFLAWIHFKSPWILNWSFLLLSSLSMLSSFMLLREISFISFCIDIRTRFCVKRLSSLSCINVIFSLRVTNILMFHADNRNLAVLMNVASYFNLWRSRNFNMIFFFWTNKRCRAFRYEVILKA